MSGYGTREGWLCPACKRGNAPWLPQCDCFREDKPKQQDGTTTTQEQAYMKRVQNSMQDNAIIGPGPAQIEPTFGTCPRCWQHGFVKRVHGSMEVCPYASGS